MALWYLSKSSGRSFSWANSSTSLGDGKRVAKDALRRPLRVVRVVAGQQHQIVPDALVFAYELLTRDTPAAGSRLELRIRPLEARCPSCGWQGALEPPVFLCGACGQGGIELLGGNELYLESLEVARDGERPPAGGENSAAETDR